MAGTGSKNNDRSSHLAGLELTAEEQARRQQMLKVLRATEARYKQKTQRDAAIGMGDHVTILSGPLAHNTARIQDLDYINSVAMVELDDSREREWIGLELLAPVDTD